jgi:hypothetical protein
VFDAMKPTLKMFGRYALSTGLVWLVGKGYVSEAAAGLIEGYIVDLAMLSAAALPPIFAAIKRKV